MSSANPSKNNNTGINIITPLKKKTVISDCAGKYPSYTIKNHV
jgi:hypothetical protein